jgi:hypothetical protein
MQGAFKKENNFETRVALSKRILSTPAYSNKVPVIVEVAKNNHFKLNRSKFITSDDLIVGSFIGQLRKHCDIKPEEALYILCGDGVLVPATYTMSQIYEKNKDADGFLYIIIATENAFGLNQLVNNVYSASALTFNILKQYLL